MLACVTHLAKRKMVRHTASVNDFLPKPKDIHIRGGLGREKDASRLTGNQIPSTGELYAD